METNRCAGVAMHEQILNERDENYGKVISRYSLARKSAFEELLDQGETKIMLILQHSAMLPHPPNAGQMQFKTRRAEISPLHNYHLSIFGTFSFQKNTGWWR
jgi:hypothetical protein